MLSFFKKNSQHNCKPKKVEKKETYFLSVYSHGNEYLHLNNPKKKKSADITMDLFLKAMKEGFPDPKSGGLGLGSWIISLDQKEKFTENTKNDHYQLDMEKYQGGPWEETKNIRLPDTITRHVLILEVEPSIAIRSYEENDLELLYPHIIAYRSDTISREKNEWEIGNAVPYIPENRPERKKTSCMMM